MLELLAAGRPEAVNPAEDAFGLGNVGQQVWIAMVLDAAVRTGVAAAVFVVGGAMLLGSVVRRRRG